MLPWFPFVGETAPMMPGRWGRFTPPAFSDIVRHGKTFVAPMQSPADVARQQGCWTHVRAGDRHVAPRIPGSTDWLLDDASARLRQGTRTSIPCRMGLGTCHYRGRFVYAASYGFAHDAVLVVARLGLHVFKVRQANESPHWLSRTDLTPVLVQATSVSRMTCRHEIENRDMWNWGQNPSRARETSRHWLIGQVQFRQILRVYLPGTARELPSLSCTLTPWSVDVSPCPVHRHLPRLYGGDGGRRLDQCQASPPSSARWIQHQWDPRAQMSQQPYQVEGSRTPGVCGRIRAGQTRRLDAAALHRQNRGLLSEASFGRTRQSAHQILKPLELAKPDSSPQASDEPGAAYTAPKLVDGLVYLTRGDELCYKQPALTGQTDHAERYRSPSLCGGRRRETRFNVETRGSR